MADPAVDGNRVAAYLKAQVADLSGDLAVVRAQYDALAAEHAKALRALEAAEKAEPTKAEPKTKEKK